MSSLSIIMLVVVLYISLFFSCSSDVELPLPPKQDESSSSEDWQSSSDTELELSSSSSNVEYGSSSSALCGTTLYDPATQICIGDILYSECNNGDVLYNLATHFCSGITIYPLCGGEKYNPAMEECIDNVVTEIIMNGTFMDNRDMQSYNWVKIGNQIWMAENLNYNATGSVCYDDDTNNCTIYGRLYDWSTAMMACPYGWHIPSDAEWNILVNNVGGEAYAGTKLKAIDGWNSDSNANLDIYGFSALPGGYGDSDGNFRSTGYSGIWWGALEDKANAYYAYYRIMDYDGEYTYRGSDDKNLLFSVRCLQY